jgi:hypothetical protein
MSSNQRKKFLWILFLIGLGLLALISKVSATTLARLSFDELSIRANAIARMRCVRNESHWKSGEIWTRSEFAVIEENKGSLPRTLTVEMPGGIVGHLHSRVDEVPKFAPGEEAYLFLWAAPDGSFRILGWSQGSFRIRKNHQTGLETVTQDSAASPVFDPVSRRFLLGGVHDLPIAAFHLKLERASNRH